MSNYKKPSRFDFDLIVIGSGGGGGVAAHLAANEGKKVGLIEAHRLGGDAPLAGSIPTEALLKAAKTVETIQFAHQFGIRATGVNLNYRSIQAWKDKAIAATGVYNESSTFKHEGITIFKGRAHFLGPWEVSLGLKHLKARKFLIATGSLPFMPDIHGLDQTGFITYKQASSLIKLPKSIFIIGGGHKAYEYSQIFSAFGVRVHVAEIHDHLLPSEDPEAGDSAEAALAKRGIRVHTGAKVIQVSGNTSRKIVTFEQQGQQHHVVVEEIMVAAGKQPNIDLGLENIGIRYNEAGISVNRSMQTRQKHIYAAGGVLGIDYSTHTAIQQGRVAIHNMYHRKKIAMSYHAIPRCYSGHPEIACVGISEWQARLTGEIYQTSIAPIGILGRAITSNYSQGIVKIIANQNGVILGASIVAPHASEMLPELTFAIQHHQNACAVANTVHAFPTWGEAIRIAAGKIRCT